MLSFRLLRTACRDEALAPLAEITARRVPPLDFSAHPQEDPPIRASCGSAKVSRTLGFLRIPVERSPVVHLRTQFAKAAASALLAVTAIGCVSTSGPSLESIHAPGYARTTWAAVHGDSSNSDYVPLATTAPVKERWHVLEGAAIWTAPSVAPDGTIYTATGRGPGFRHLHAIDPSGRILWESAPQRSLDDLDSGAVISCPVIDDDGDVYLGDSNQLWAFRPGGEVKWVADLSRHGVTAPFVTALIVRGYVGGISADGKVIFFDRRDGSLAMPVLDLPGGANPLGPPIPQGLWGGGLIDPAIRDLAWEVLMGFRYEVANTPAVHPRTGRIFLMASGRTPEQGAFYGIDVTKEGLRIAFEVPVSAGSGTSPTLSIDGRSVYSTGGDGKMFAFDTESGKLLWTVDVGGQAASPAVSPDGSLYANASEAIVSMNGEDGRILWSRNYDDFASKLLPRIPEVPGLIPDGRPVARADSVVTMTPGRMWAVLLLGYQVRAGAHTALHPVRAMLVSLRPFDGAVMSASPIPDSSEGGISIGPNGDLYLDLLTAIASIAHYGAYHEHLPAALRLPEPRGGIVAFTPESQRELAGAGLGWADALLSLARDQLAGGELEATRRTLDLARVQLRAASEATARAVDGGELATTRAEALREAMAGAQTELGLAADRLRSRIAPASAKRRFAEDAIERADGQIERSRGIAAGR